MEAEQTRRAAAEHMQRISELEEERAGLVEDYKKFTDEIDVCAWWGGSFF